MPKIPKNITIDIEPAISGAILIAAERDKHKRVGFDGNHDDHHRMSELVAAAYAYIYAAELGKGATAWLGDPPYYWPWEPEAWKPADDPVRNLVKAGSFIAAEIDRIRRTES